jgi:hypothetical protein
MAIKPTLSTSHTHNSFYISDYHRQDQQTKMLKLQK